MSPSLKVRASLGLASGALPPSEVHGDAGTWQANVRFVAAVSRQEPNPAALASP